MLYKVVLTFKSVDETPVSGHASKERFQLTSNSDVSGVPRLPSVVNRYASVVPRLLYILYGKHAIRTSPCEPDAVQFPHNRRLWEACGRAVQVNHSFWVDCDRLRGTGDDWFLEWDYKRRMLTLLLPESNLESIINVVGAVCFYNFAKWNSRFFRHFWT